MKEAKVLSKIGILSTNLGLAAIIVLLNACDVLEADPDVLEPSVEITGKEIVVLANAASYIDLQSKVQTTQPLRLAITAEPKNGKLTDLGQGMLQYTPSTGSSRGSDAFEFTAYSSSNEIIKKDTVVVIIENDSTNLPCNIYPMVDYVYDAGTSASTIDVLANDIICASNVVVSVYKPATSFPPFNGTAEAKDNKIIYHPGSTFNGTDKIMYRVADVSNPSRVAFGMVYVTKDSSCAIRIHDDYFVYDSLQPGSSVSLPVFLNDSLCRAVSQYQVAIKSGPQFGRVSQTSNGFQYEVPAIVPNGFWDQFTYEVCVDAACKTAKVRILSYNNTTSGCVLLAVADSVVFTNPALSQISVNVLKNDSICGSLKSMTITNAPKYGSASINNVSREIVYIRDPLMNKDDSVRYTICSNQTCSSALLYIKRTN